MGIIKIPLEQFNRYEVFVEKYSKSKLGIKDNFNEDRHEMDCANMAVIIKKTIKYLTKNI